GAQYTREDNRVEGPNHIVLGTLSVPVPAVEHNQGARAAARADLYVARAELDAARSLLTSQVARARSEVAAAAARVRAYGTEILPRLVENLSLLRRSFELGEIDLMELSIGRERFLRIQSDALVGHLDYFVALAGLERAVGADLWRDEQHEEHNP
ncbi:MAG TPA: TolC family protein, partial [Polyangiales bacterium]|nr:TolC family protein [Polyangiales bacterium]